MANFHWSNITNPENPIFIIAESGSNWKSGNYEDDLEQAKKLIDAASNASANAIKFQTYSASKLTRIVYADANWSLAELLNAFFCLSI